MFKIGLRRVLFCVLFAPLLVRPAAADVIYDVDVNYAGGYKYSFAMRFADATGTKTSGDLLDGDFIGETFTGPGSIYTLIDGPVRHFSFIPNASILFFGSSDFFIGSCVCFATSFTERSASIDDPLTGQSQTPQLTSMFVVLRAGDVPEPGTLGLLAAAGLAAIALRRRRGGEGQRNFV